MVPTDSGLALESGQHQFPCTDRPGGSSCRGTMNAASRTAGRGAPAEPGLVTLCRLSEYKLSPAGSGHRLRTW